MSVYSRITQESYQVKRTLGPMKYAKMQAMLDRLPLTTLEDMISQGEADPTVDPLVKLTIIKRLSMG